MSIFTVAGDLVEPGRLGEGSRRRGSAPDALALPLDDQVAGVAHLHGPQRIGEGGRSPLVPLCLGDVAGDLPCGAVRVAGGLHDEVEGEVLGARVRDDERRDPAPGPPSRTSASQRPSSQPKARVQVASASLPTPPVSERVTTLRSSTMWVLDGGSVTTGAVVVTAAVAGAVPRIVTV